MECVSGGVEMSLGEGRKVRVPRFLSRVKFRKSRRGK
jgi:hypothetical protein